MHCVPKGAAYDLTKKQTKQKQTARLQKRYRQLYGVI